MSKKCINFALLKERDGETGYDYFGARYFWSALGHWLSVDPLADKYPGISPYAYCAWNPIKYVDPDGKEATISFAVFKNQNEKDRIKNMRLKERCPLSPINTINNDYTVIWAHGAEDGTYMEYAAKSADSKGNIVDIPINIGSLELFQTLYAYNKSFAKDPNSVVIFGSCNTGKSNGIASEFSILASGSVIIAPTDKVAISKDGSCRVKNNGHWNVFVDGKIVDTIKGDKGALEKYLSANSDKEALLKKYRGTE